MVLKSLAIINISSMYYANVKPLRPASRQAWVTNLTNSTEMVVKIKGAYDAPNGNALKRATLLSGKRIPIYYLLYSPKVT
jgi:G3E family GTPase